MDSGNFQVFLFNLRKGREKENAKFIEYFEPYIISKCKKFSYEKYSNELIYDLVQEVTIGLIKAIHFFKGKNKKMFYGYCHKVIENKIKNIIKKEQKNKKNFSFYLDIIEDFQYIQILPSKENVERKVLDKLQEEYIVEKVIKSILTDREYELFKIIMYKQYTLKEYAILKGIKENTIRKRKERLLKKIRKKIGKKFLIN